MPKKIIYAEDAIDALMEILDRPNHAEFLYTDEICKALEDLPSAQPTQNNTSNALTSLDCIDRQAAIDALGEKPLVWDDLSDFDLGKAAQWSDDVDAIKELPSAQPEIIRCRDCKYYADNSVPQEQMYVCDLDGYRWSPDSYCSFAERKEDE